MKPTRNRALAIVSLTVAAGLPLAAKAQQSATAVQEITVNGILPSVDDTYRAPPAVDVGPLGARPPGSRPDERQPARQAARPQDPHRRLHAQG